MDTSPTEDSYRQARIQALKRNGSIVALKAEADAIKEQIARHFEEASRNERVFDIGFVTRQVERAHEFEAEAHFLDKQRPAGAAGLTS